MPNISGLLNMAGNALLAHQQAINVAGNNIANVNTPGYSRQKLIMASSRPQQSAIGLIGDGVNAVRVERVYDRFVGIQINTESQSLGRWRFRPHLQIPRVLYGSCLPGRIPGTASDLRSSSR